MVVEFYEEEVYGEEFVGGLCLGVWMSVDGWKRLRWG